MRRSLLLFCALLLASLHVGAQPPAEVTSGWQRLHSELREASIIGLGEAGHGYESFNESKGMVVDFLRQQLGIEGVVFESSLTLSAIGYLRSDSFDNRLKYFLYPFWNTASVNKALRPFYQREGGGKPLIMGFDVQEDCRFTCLSQYLLHEGIIQTNAAGLLASDSILSYYIGKDFSRRGTLKPEEYSMLTSNYELIATELASHPLPAIKRKLLTRCLQNRKWLCRYLTLSGAKERMHFRDSVMAENVVWLKNEWYADDKIVLWAANTHVAAQREGIPPQWMGEWLSSYYRKAYYPISFQKGSFAETESLGPGFGVRYPAKQDKFKAVVVLNTVRKISAKQWETPCD